MWPVTVPKVLINASLASHRGDATKTTKLTKKINDVHKLCYSVGIEMELESWRGNAIKTCQCYFVGIKII